MTPYLRSLLRLRQDERLAALREKAKSERDPCAPDETVQLLLACARMCAPTRALEIGTGEGLTAVALLQECPRLHLVTVESDEARYRAACKNFAAFGVAERVRCVLGDAKDLLAALDEPFGLIFLDGPKAQYGGYLPDLKRLLAVRGRRAVIWLGGRKGGNASQTPLDRAEDPRISRTGLRRSRLAHERFGCRRRGRDLRQKGIRCVVCLA